MIRERIGTVLMGLGLLGLTALILLSRDVAPPAWAQNTTCATRPAGDNSNACASTAFVDTAIAGAVPSLPLSIANGGTGQVTAAAAFDALAPCSTRGSVLYKGVSNWSCLVPGTNGQVLTTAGAGADPSWTAASSGTVTSVGLTSTDLSVSNSPITTSGNITANISTGAVTNAKLADMANSTIKCRTTSGTGAPEDCTAAQIEGIIPGFFRMCRVAVDFNTTNTDHQCALTIPTGITRVRLNGIFLLNTGTTASLTTARGGVFTATGGGGTTIAADQALSGITSNANNNAANILAMTAAGGAGWLNVSTLTAIYYRNSTPQGAAASGIFSLWAQAVD